MIKKIHSILCFLLLMMLLIACEKITGPANIKIDFAFQVPDSLSEDDLFIKEDIQDFPLKFKKGRIIVHSINFEGSREEGDNVVFTSNFDTVIVADLVNGTTNFPVVFDVPQGTYAYINLSIYINRIGNIPALNIAGKYTGDVLQTTNASKDNGIDFDYAFYEKEVLNLTVKTDENEDMVISEINHSTIKVAIDPVFIFQNTISKFQNADAGSNEDASFDNNIIYVSKDTNINIYDETVSGSRIEKASNARLTKK